MKEISDKLIIAGQLTMCFNLMTYIEGLRNSDVWLQFEVSYRDEVNSIFDQCKRDWLQLKHDPYFLID